MSTPPAAIRHPRTVDVDDAIKLLNEMVRISHGTVTKMVLDRVKCSPDLAKHPTIQVGEQPFPPEGRACCCVGLLGVMNGLFGVDEKGWGAIQAVLSLEKEDRIIRFERVPHFGVPFDKWEAIGK